MFPSHLIEGGVEQSDRHVRPDDSHARAPILLVDVTVAVRIELPEEVDGAEAVLHLHGRGEAMVARVREGEAMVAGVRE